MVRLAAILATAAACIGGGAAAGLVGFASELSWPLSGENFTHAVRLGATYGAGGAVISGACLLATARGSIWLAAPIAVAATCLVTFAAVWWQVVSAPG